MVTLDFCQFVRTVDPIQEKELPKISIKSRSILCCFFHEIHSSRRRHFASRNLAFLR